MFQLYLNYTVNFIPSVKAFKSKNRDKIYVDAPNPNLEIGCDRDSRATA